MRNFLALIGLAVIVLIGVAFYQGWLSTFVISDDKKIDIILRINRQKMSTEKEEYVKSSETRIKEYDERLHELRTKAKAGKDLDGLSEKMESAQQKLNEVRTAAGDKWQDLKPRLEAALDDLKEGFEKATSRFRDDEEKN